MMRASNMMRWFKHHDAGSFFVCGNHVKTSLLVGFVVETIMDNMGVSP